MKPEAAKPTKEYVHKILAENDQLKSKVAWLQSKLDEAFKVWEEVDNFVRPKTDLGYTVSGRTLELLKEGEANKEKLDEIKKQPVLAYGVPNSRITESQSLCDVYFRVDGLQYPELLIPLIAKPL